MVSPVRGRRKWTVRSDESDLIGPIRPIPRRDISDLFEVNLQYYRNMTINEAAGLAAVFGNRARLTIFQLLLQSRPQGLVVGDIQKAVKIPGSTLSHHLERLRDSGLVTIRRQGTFLWYLPVPERVRSFADLLLGLSASEVSMTPEAPTHPETTGHVDVEFD